MEKLLSFIKDVAKSFIFILPVAFICLVIYMFYSHFIKVDSMKTVEDIQYMTKKIREERQEVVFMNFDNDTIVYSNFLPIDLKSQITDHGYIIESRFGTKINFIEAYRTSGEKEYYADKSNRYKGKGAYIITFPHIRRSACMHLAQVDWRTKVPNFMGIEVGRTNDENPNIGTERLNLGLLEGENEIDYNGPDESFVANRKLQYREAFKACHCLVHNKCVVSLKFY